MKDFYTLHIYVIYIDVRLACIFSLSMRYVHMLGYDQEKSAKENVNILQEVGILQILLQALEAHNFVNISADIDFCKFYFLNILDI